MNHISLVKEVTISTVNVHTKIIIQSLSCDLLEVHSSHTSLDPDDLVMLVQYLSTTRGFRSSPTTNC